MFSLLSVFVFMYYFCQNYYKPITKPIAVQCYIANCVSWAPRLTLLNLQTNWNYQCTLRTEFICM